MNERRGTKDEGRLILYVDGAARSNPGPAGIGGVIYDLAGRKLATLSEYIGETTNNVAEYSALILVLEEALKGGKEKKVKGVEIYSDSKLLVSQLKGEYKIKNPSLKPLFERVKALLKNPIFGKVGINHIPREENLEADGLANQAIDKALKGEKEIRVLKGIPAQEKIF